MWKQLPVVSYPDPNVCNVMCITSFVYRLRIFGSGYETKLPDWPGRTESSGVGTVAAVAAMAATLFCTMWIFFFYDCQPTCIIIISTTAARGSIDSIQAHHEKGIVIHYCIIVCI